MTKEKKQKIIHHVLTIAFLIVAVLFSIFRFEDVFKRTVQSLVDLKNSCLYFVLYPLHLEHLVEITVLQIPEHMITMLPLTPEEFVQFCERFWDIFVSWETVEEFFEYVGDVLRPLAETLLYLLLPMLSTFGVLWFIYSRVDVPEETQKAKKRKKKKDSKKAAKAQKEEAKERPNAKKKAKKKKKGKPESAFPDSKALQRWKRFEVKVLFKIRNAVVNYAAFFKSKKYYVVPMIVIWAYNLNGATIALEALAWLFYVSISIEYHTILIMLAKLAVDLTVVAGFLPWWAWVIVGYKVYDYIRRSIGDALLKHYIAKDEEFLIKHPGALFVVGKQRSKKTTILTLLKIIFERRFREIAKKKFAQRNKQFPFFRWSSIERTVRCCRENNTFKTFEDMTIFVLYLKNFFSAQNSIQGQNLRYAIKVKYGYDVQELVDYASRYSMLYDNDVVETSIFEAIERYAQLFFIYSQTSPLDISNFSIREDFTFKDHGFFPIFDGDLFRKSKDSKKNSQFSHRIKFDIFRPGKVFDPETRYDEAVEYGIGVLQEFAKDRKNRYTKAGKQNDLDVNQDNDLFELDTKMRGHVATIDFFDFWVWLFDDQRPGSLGADNKDLTTICRIKETSDAKIILPGFAIEELLFGWLDKLHDKLKYYIRNRKEKETLLVHFIDAIFNPFFKHFDKVSAHYGVHVAKLKVEDGGDGEILGEAEKLYIPVRVPYANRFATDNWRIFYRMKNRKAKRTLDKIEQYKSIYPTMEDFRAQQSYAVEDMNYAYGDKEERKKKTKK